MEKSEKAMKYADAIAEIEQILSQLHAESVSVDELEQKVKRATELIELCRERLCSVEKSVGALLAEEQ